MNLKSNFFKDGFVSGIRILSQETADRYAEEYRKFLSETRSRTSLVEHKTKTHLFFDWANEIVHNKVLVDSVCEILGDNVLCWNSLIFFKPRGSNSFVSLHQDQNYWGIEQDKALSVSVAISNSTSQNGCLQLLKGSHNKNYEHFDLNDRANMLARGQTIKLDGEERSNLTDIELERGECVIFHGNLVHGSGLNVSAEDRFLFTIRYLTPDNKVSEALYYTNATLVSGHNENGYFTEENSSLKTPVEERVQQHQAIVLKQFERYVSLAVKSQFVTKFLMVFLRFRTLRGLAYALKGKT